MGIKERLHAIKLLKKQNKNPEYAKRLGVKVKIEAIHMQR